ncbi:MAG TPA: DUF3883 domain-containing protein [Planctomycetota bacterium]|nr:DUF3883 domain-containing protein [Planctomycetota bacterium]
MSSAGKHDLADLVEHVSITRGDGLGFDIHSFEVDGSNRFIEVKTTTQGKQTPFFVSRNEVDVSRELGQRYQLYRVFRVKHDASLFNVPGSLTETFSLQPEMFRARVK